MSYKNKDQCKREIESLALIAFSRGYRDSKPREYGFLKSIGQYTEGLARSGLRALVQATKHDQPVIDYMPLEYSAQLAEKAFEYNIPGYEWTRIEREMRILQRRMQLAQAIEDQDPKTISEAYDALQSTMLNNDRQDSVDGVFATGDLADQMLDLYEQGLTPGKSTGWLSVDQFYTVRPGEFTIITGMPGSGKTTWLDALVVNMWRQHGWKFAFCSPENWPISRHAAHISEKVMQKPFSKAERFSGRMSKRELEWAIDKMDGAFWFSQLQEDSMSVETILQAMERLVQQHEIHGLVLDPWNELEHRRPNNKNESEFISEALGRIRRFARFNNIHVWLVAHPQKLQKNEKNVYPVPTPYNISGSAAFFNKADICLTVHRPDKDAAKTDIHIQKVKFKEVGQKGKASLGYVNDTGTYIDNQLQPSNSSEASAF